MGKNKYREILDYIRDAILSGRYKAGDRLPTDGQLMRQFKTSRPTAARAMRDLETEGFLERRAGSGSFVRVPAQTKSSLIGLLTPELGSAEIFEPICSEIAARCQKHNLSLLWADSSGEVSANDMELESKLHELCQRYIDLKVSGVFFAPVEFSKHMNHVNRDIAERLDEAGISVVLLDRDLDRMPNRSRFDLVSVDNFRIGFLQTDYMVGLGCKKVAYVSRGDSAPTIDLRIFGYKSALEYHNLKSSSLIFSGNVENEEFVRKMVKKKPDAIVCSNDSTAAGLLQSLTRMGVDVPGEVKIIGVDDIKISNFTSVPLTSVHQPCRELGRAAVATMIRRIENRKMAALTVFVGVELNVRESCGAKALGR